MSKKKLLQGAAILLAASIVTRILGLVFRVYLSNKLGAEGMGLYQLVLSLYMLVVTFATNGVNVAVSRMVAEQLEINRYGSKKNVLMLSVAYSLAISLAAAFLLFAFAGPLGGRLLDDPRTIRSLQFLAPSLPFMAVAACVKGYCVAMRNTVTPSVAQVLEQVVKMAFIAILLALLMPYGIETACTVTVIGMTVGEMASCSYLMARYWRTKPREEHCPRRYWRETFKGLVNVSLPIQTSSTFHSLLRLAENLLIVSGLKAFAGGDATQAVSSYGILKGMVMPLLFFPTSLLSALVTTLIPEVAGANVGGNRRMVYRTVSKVLQLTLMMSVLIVAVFMIFPNQIGTLVYGQQEVGEMLQMLCLICPFMYLEMVTVGILNAVGEQMKPMIYNILDSLLRIAVIYFLVPKFGITAFLWIMIGSNLFTSILNLRQLLKVTGVGVQVVHWIVKPAVAAGSAGLVIRLVCSYCLADAFPLWCQVILGVLVMGTAYLVLLLALGCIRRSDLVWVRECFRHKTKTRANPPA